MICDRQTDARGKTICLPTLKGGDIITDCAIQTTSVSCIYRLKTYHKTVQSLIMLCLWSIILQVISIAPDKAAYCVFTQFRKCENAIIFISVRTKTQ